MALITQRECSKLHYSAEKDRLVWCGFCCFAVWGSSASSARSAGYIGFSLEYSYVGILSQIAQMNDACASECRVKLA